MNKKVGRNDPCPCGSGKKYKNCCMAKETEAKKTYTASGKRKFRAKLLSDSTISQGLFQSASVAPLSERKIKPIEPQRFKQTTEDFRTKKQAPLPFQPSDRQPSKKPSEQTPTAAPGEAFKPTTEDFRENTQ